MTLHALEAGTAGAAAVAGTAGAVAVAGTAGAAAVAATAGVTVAGKIAMVSSGRAGAVVIVTLESPSTGAGEMDGLAAGPAGITTAAATGAGAAGAAGVGAAGCSAAEAGAAATGVTAAGAGAAGIMLATGIASAVTVVFPSNALTDRSVVSETQRIPGSAVKVTVKVAVPVAGSFVESGELTVPFTANAVTEWPGLPLTVTVTAVFSGTFEGSGFGAVICPKVLTLVANNATGRIQADRRTGTHSR